MEIKLNTEDLEPGFRFIIENTIDGIVTKKEKIELTKEQEVPDPVELEHDLLMERREKNKKLEKSLVGINYKYSLFHNYRSAKDCIFDYLAMAWENISERIGNINFDNKDNNYLKVEVECFKLEDRFSNNAEIRLYPKFNKDGSVAVEKMEFKIYEYNNVKKYRTACIKSYALYGGTLSLKEIKMFSHEIGIDFKPNTHSETVSNKLCEYVASVSNEFLRIHNVCEHRTSNNPLIEAGYAVLNNVLNTSGELEILDTLTFKYKIDDDYSIIIHFKQYESTDESIKVEKIHLIMPKGRVIFDSCDIDAVPSVTLPSIKTFINYIDIPGLYSVNRYSNTKQVYIALRDFFSELQFKIRSEFRSSNK